MIVYTRFGSAAETDTPILPSSPDEGSPGFLVISLQCSPPSVDLNNPDPGPPLDIDHSLRNASQSAAYITSGLVRSIEMSTPPVLSSRYKTLRQVFPPSVVLKIPRSSLGPPYLPKEATNTTSGLRGSMRTLAIASEFSKPMCVQVFPASVDL